ncbi:MAG TPA: hypothetical protein VFD16_00700 [Candidatus Saccharimonadales bacterium]|nr:hypothetical protein [Candidatus Saccharimonadales bacterium]
MQKINKKRILFCLGTLVIVLTLAFLLYKPVIFQEGNPTPLLKGIIQLNFSRDKIVRLDMDGDRYLTKGKNGQEVLVNLLNNQGYEFIDQMGSGYFFKDNNDNALLATHRQYSRSYSIWSLSITKNAKEKIDEKLFVVSGEFVCLPLKDENVPHNDLCIFGIKNSNSEYYRLQAPSDDKNNVVNKTKKGQRIEISGELINEESDVYKTLGTIKVSGIKSLYTDEKNIESYLPDSFKADYISFQNYGSGIFKVAEYPHLESWVENGEIECNETPLESSLSPRIRKQEINGKKYCIGASSEGAAGSVYTQYAYTTVIGDNVYSVQFVARYPNCNNYPEEENIKCKTERENFALDILVDQEIEKMRN